VYDPGNAEATAWAAPGIGAAYSQLSRTGVTCWDGKMSISSMLSCSGKTRTPDQLRICLGRVRDFASAVRELAPTFL
jgi:hypothetical protein